MTLLLGIDQQPVAWPTPRARLRWARITSASLHTTWKKANPREAAALEAFWTQPTAPLPTVQTAYGKHLLEHAHDLRALAERGVVS